MVTKYDGTQVTPQMRNAMVRRREMGRNARTLHIVTKMLEIPMIQQDMVVVRLFIGTQNSTYIHTHIYALLVVWCMTASCLPCIAHIYVHDCMYHIYMDMFVCMYTNIINLSLLTCFSCIMSSFNYIYVRMQRTCKCMWRDLPAVSKACGEALTKAWAGGFIKLFSFSFLIHLN